MSKYYVIKLYYPGYPKNQTYGYLKQGQTVAKGGKDKF